jgi:hypothetical protein
LDDFWTSLVVPEILIIPINSLLSANKGDRVPEVASDYCLRLNPAKGYLNKFKLQGENKISKDLFESFYNKKIQ